MPHERRVLERVSASGCGNVRAARVADVKSSAVAPVAHSLPPGRAGHAKGGLWRPALLRLEPHPQALPIERHQETREDYAQRAHGRLLPVSFLCSSHGILLGGWGTTSGTAPLV